MLRDFIGIRVNRAKKSGMVNITSSVNSRERSGINTILHELNPLFTINVTMRDIKSKNVYSRVNSKAKIILIKQELLLLVYELNRSGLLAENEKIRPILAQLEKLLLCDLSPSTNDSVKN